jgi:dienelactone hydrolase
MKRILTLITVLCFMATVSFAQTRYVDETFSNVTITQHVYGQNYTIITVPTTGSAALQPLAMDFYQPTGDTEAERPLVILLHTGNFLPNPQNGSVSGTMKDSFIVEVATRLAKTGYVVAVADYRAGWNPLATTQPERTEGLIQAAYRGIQDARTCVRFFKKDYAENSNSFSIDTSRITMFGQGTGGYISLGAATINEYSQLLLPKFVNASGFPMVIEPIHGNIHGTSYGVVPVGAGSPLDGDTISLPNHVGYSSDFQLCVNAGGALGDSSWLTAGDPAMISFHTTKDPFAPYTEGVLTVPTTGNLIVNVQGSAAVQFKANAVGNNDIMKSAWYNDEFTTAANANNNGLEGLYPFYLPTQANMLEQGAPWEWWDAAYWSQAVHPSCQGAPVTACNFHTINSLNNSDMSDTKARTYIDTIMGYFAPRACAVLDLPCSTVSTEKILSQDEVQLVIAPNPASDYVRFSSEAGKTILAVYLFDLNGRLVQSENNVNNTQFEMRRTGLPTGLYIAKVKFEDGIITQKLMFD